MGGKEGVRGKREGVGGKREGVGGESAEERGVPDEGEWAGRGWEKVKSLTESSCSLFHLE